VLIGNGFAMQSPSIRILSLGMAHPIFVVAEKLINQPFLNVMMPAIGQGERNHRSKSPNS
jgi:hypothetical protein